MSNLTNFNEEWKPVAEFPCYEVSNLGQVRHVRLKNILRPWTDTNGYKKVSISLGKDGRYVRSVHRLLAIAFIPNPENKPEVNHKDRVRSNYALDNLEWVTPKENAIHAHKDRIRKPPREKKGRSRKLALPKIKKPWPKVIVYQHGELVGVYRSATRAGAAINMNRRSILNWVHGRVSKSRFGYSVVVEGQL